MAEPTGKLVESAVHGDQLAVEELLARFLPDLEGYVRKHAGGVVADRESTADLTQSVCRELLERLADERFTWRGEPEFRAWLFQAALLKIQGRARYWRASMRDPACEVRAVGEASEAAPEPVHRGRGPASAVARAEEIERLRAALGQLPERSREVVRLVHFEGLSHAEVAQRLGIAEGHSRVLLARALARLGTLGLPPEAR